MIHSGRPREVNKLPTISASIFVIAVSWKRPEKLFANKFSINAYTAVQAVLDYWTKMVINCDWIRRILNEATWIGNISAENGKYPDSFVFIAFNSVAHKWRHDSDKTQTNKLEWWMILKISLRAKGGVPKTLLEQKHRLNFLYFPQNTLMLTESREEFSDLHSIFRLRALRYSCPATR